MDLCDYDQRDLAHHVRRHLVFYFILKSTNYENQYNYKNAIERSQNSSLPEDYLTFYS